ncbi:HORMA domain-containing protein 1 isoform X2 [Stigmatopora argus]
MACVPQKEITKNQLFTEEIVSEQQSLTYIKLLLATGVSGIMYLRGFFPANAYRSSYVQDQKVMILRAEHSCPPACRLVEWLRGCFDAIQMKYLRSVIMTLSSNPTGPNEPQNVTEFYHFRIHYDAKGAQLDFESTPSQNVASFGNTKMASILLVRKLYTLIQHLGPLPSKIFLNMKLTYNDSVTPRDYQPRGFEESDSDLLVFEREPIKLEMGEVVTPFHSFKLDMGTERHRLEPVEELPNRRNRWFLKVRRDGSLSQRSEIEDVEETQENDSTGDNSQEIDLSCTENCEVTMTEEVVAEETNGTDASVMAARTELVFHQSSTNKATKVKEKGTQKKNKVYRYDIPNSQETNWKKRKFSECKENV